MGGKNLLLNYLKPHPITISALITLSLLLAGLCLSRLIYPFDLGHLEACTWTPSLLSASGQNPYSFAESPPFVMAPYGYFYYLLIGGGLRVFGFQLWFGRAASVLSAAFCATCIVRMAFILTRNRAAALFGAIAFLSSITVHHWIAVHRPDLLALALAFAGLTIVFETCERPGQWTWKIIPAMAFFVAAIFFKQTILLPAIVAVVRCCQSGKFKTAVTIGAGVTTVSLLIVLWLNLSSGGEYFWQHFLLMRQIPHSYADALHWVAALFKAPATWLATVILTAASWQGVETGLSPITGKSDSVQMLKSPIVLVAGYFVTASALAFVASARRGAYISYYLEAFIAGSIVVAVACDFLVGRNIRQQLYAALLALMMFSGFIGIVRAARGEYFRWQSLPYYREIVATLKRETTQQGLCISVHPELVVAAERAYHFGDWYQYADGRSPELQALLKNSIASGRYEAVIWLTDDAGTNLLPGYRLIRMQEPPPANHFPVFLYVRSGPK